MTGETIHPDDYSELIIKYLSDNASDDEMHRLEAWVASAPEHKDQFIAAKKAWMLSGLGKDPMKLDPVQAWSVITEHIGDGDAAPKETHRLIRPRLLWRVAAVVSILVGMSIWLFNLVGGASLTLIAQNGVQEHGLPDGSVVALNRYASVTYQPTSGDKYRKVALEGDAFFEVARDTLRPFLIETQALEIEVLGTAFYVDARPGQSETAVIVQSGKVAVRQGGRELILTANETAIFSKSTQSLTKRINKDKNFLGWRSNELQFDHTNLKEVIYVLNRHFHSQVVLENPALEDCALTAVYRNKSLSSIVKIIENTLGLSSHEDGAKIILSGETCN